MMRIGMIILVASAAMGAATGPLFAQSFAGAGSGSGSGGSGGGGSTSAFGSSSSAFGSSSSSSGGGFASSGFQSGFSSSGFSGGSTGGSSTTTGVGLPGGAQSIYGLPTIGGQANRGTTGTTGTQGGGNRSTSSSSSGRSGQGSSSTAGARRGGGGGRNGSNQTNNASSTRQLQQQAWFAPRLEIGFDIAQRAPAAVTASVGRSIYSTSLHGRFSGVQITVEGETAVLRGSVASMNDRQLVEQIALLEPSISSVRNEVTLVPRATGAVPNTVPNTVPSAVPNSMPPSAGSPL